MSNGEVHAPQIGVRNGEPVGAATRYRLRLFNTQSGVCFYRGCAMTMIPKRPHSGNGCTLDHMIPAARGGGRGKNLVACCYTCNQWKAVMTAAEFLLVIAFCETPELISRACKIINADLSRQINAGGRVQKTKIVRVPWTERSDMAWRQRKPKIADVWPVAPELGEFHPEGTSGTASST